MFFIPLLLLLTWWWNCLPTPLFDNPLATELLDKHGELLSAHIASDGQWRMPAADSISTKLKQCVVAFEDERFYGHPGIDPVAIARALGDNHRAGRTVSGGSTLTMQVARMARDNPPRNVWQKSIEALMALRLEVALSKEELLDLWLDNAPFGGNVVGIEAACRRYYGRSPASLSWAEAAALAVLPNSPALIHPGRNLTVLRKKRDALLHTLSEQGILPAQELELALIEPLPHEPKALPRHAPHYLQRQLVENGPGRYRSNIDARLQQTVGRLLHSHHQQLAANQIHNLAVMVSEVATGEVVAYHGNVADLPPRFAPAVDLITAPRSPGSLLKPLLYGYALDAGTLLPRELLPDVPSSFQNFRPANFYRSYDGAVAADVALARSLNIPFVYLLRDHGIARFHQQLATAGFDHLDRPAEHYGLSLILGGGEITMEEIHGWFLGVAQQLRFYHDRRQAREATDHAGLSAGASYQVFEALRELRRPDESGAYQQFESSRPVAWKTGTSFGFRDAWAVGATPAYVVSVWAGNADGTGRPGLVGVKAAAPLLFSVLRALEAYPTRAPTWFEPPIDDLRQVVTCSQSGQLASDLCPVDTVWLPRQAHPVGRCSYHEQVTLTPDLRYRTVLDCSPEAILQAWFSLPPRQAYYYRRSHPDYRSLPPWLPACSSTSNKNATMQLLYPEGRGTLSAAKDWQGNVEPFHFSVAHEDAEATVYWHIDGLYHSATRTFHDLAIALPTGHHRLTLVDSHGQRLERKFLVK